MTGEFKTPVWVAIKNSEPISGKRIIAMLTVSLLPVAIAVLMQNPALRQRIVMRTASAARKACQSQADMWQSAATSMAQTYNKARL